MLNINFKLISSYIVPSLISSTIWTGLISIVFVFIIGLVIVLIKPEDEQTFTYSMIGCVFGIQIVCMIPIFSTPGVIQALGRGSGYAVLPVMFMGGFLAPIGGILGATVFPRLKFLRRQPCKKLLLLFLATYIFMAICIYTNFSLTCYSIASEWFCTEVGFR